MEIEYNYENISKVYNEVFSIIGKKKKILSNHNIKVGNFTKDNIKGILVILVIGVIISVILEINNIADEVVRSWDFIVIIFAFLIGYNQTIFSKSLKKFKKNNSTNNKVVIDDKKITDISNGVEVKIDIEKITHIIIGQYSVNILIGKDSLFLFFPIKIKDKLINTIKKHKKNIEIIELN